MRKLPHVILRKENYNKGEIAWSKLVDVKGRDIQRSDI